MADTFKAAGAKLIGEVRSDYNGFEWLGFDFMLDDDLQLSLIEVNTNPCLETQSCILLQRLVPQMLDQSLKIAVDPFFGAAEQQYQMNQEFVATEIKYSMVHEEIIKGIRSTPFWEDTYLAQSAYHDKMHEEGADKSKDKDGEDTQQKAPESGQDKDAKVEPREADSSKREQAASPASTIEASKQEESEASSKASLE